MNICLKTVTLNFSTSQTVALHYTLNSFNRSHNMIIHHGLMGNSKNFNSISKNSHISKYSNSILIDSRNHGLSPHTATHTIENLAEDLYALIQRLELHKNSSNSLTLLGHSMGALALMGFTEKYPEMQELISRVILVDMGCKGRASENQVDGIGSMLKRVLAIDLEQTTHEVFEEIEKRAGSKDTAGLLKTNIKIEGEKQHKWIPNLKTLVQEYNNIINFELKENKWRKPVEVIYGSKSNMVNQEQIENYCRLYPQMNKQNNFHRVEGAGHWVHFEKTAEFLKIMEEILKKDVLV